MTTMAEMWENASALEGRIETIKHYLVDDPCGVNILRAHDEVLIARA